MQTIKKDDSKFMKELKRFIFVTIGAALLAFNVKSFVRTGGLFPGGFSGITILIQQICEKFLGTTIPYTAIYIPLNLIPIYIGLKHLGTRFTIYSIYCIVLSSILTDILPNITITYDVLLISIFGGIINGCAISLCLFVGASGGGTDFISIYMAEKRGIDTWNYIFAGNIAILTVAGLAFGFDRALYSIVFQFVITQIIQTLYKRYQKVTMLIITEQPSAIYGKIKELTNHDATLFKGIGFYIGAERNMVYSVVSKEEASLLLKVIKDIDPKAFVNTVKTEEVMGRFYRSPKE